MSEHTPGPWAVMPSDEREQTELAEVWGGWSIVAPIGRDTNRMEDEANARLMAAAPDMFEALTEPCSLSNNGTFADDLEALANFLVELQFGATSRDLRNKAQQIRAAIAKAQTAPADQPTT